MGRKEPTAAPAPTLRRHVAQLAQNRLRRLAYAVGRTAKSADTEAVHDLRVAIRRLAQCLRVFEQFFPRDKTRKIRRALKEMVDRASEVRDRDVALALVASAKIAPKSDLPRRLADDRRAAQLVLVTELKQWIRGNLSRKWRSALEM
ncbi:MAG TPA: CHAD domain-containing protein [Bryobacteraceae bacterium]|nr:CHAD domain-containing protein [Bryobacteraceae bacterium]